MLRYIGALKIQRRFDFRVTLRASSVKSKHEILFELNA